VWRGWRQSHTKTMGARLFRVGLRERNFSFESYFLATRAKFQLRELNFSYESGISALRARFTPSSAPYFSSARGNHIHVHEASFQQLLASTCVHCQVRTSRGRGSVPGDSQNFESADSALCQISERDSNQVSFERRVSNDRRSSELVQKIVFVTCATFTVIPRRCHRR
jgi:hypothetical protein